METFLGAGGINIKAGQLVRLLNIPMQKATNFHEYQTGKQHADALRDAWQSNHGAAGRAWVKFLAADPHQAQEAFRTAQQRWRELIPSDYGEQVHRVTKGFNKDTAARVLREAGMLKKSASSRGWQIRTPRLKHQNDACQCAYCLSFAKELKGDEAG